MKLRSAAVFGAVLFALVVGTPVRAQQQLAEPAPAQSPRTVQTGAFVVEQAITVRGTPEQAFAAITGDLRPWWDHSFSEHPRRLYLEPKVGGCFCEEFDEAGNGVRHAVVTFVQRPTLLRFEGPLGLTGNAISAVTTYTFTAHGDSTVVKVEAHVAGEIQPNWPQVVNAVWHHFLVERFKPYFERLPR